jgi:hypothetical protein
VEVVRGHGSTGEYLYGVMSDARKFVQEPPLTHRVRISSHGMEAVSRTFLSQKCRVLICSQSLASAAWTTAPPRGPPTGECRLWLKPTPVARGAPSRAPTKEQGKPSSRAFPARMRDCAKRWAITWTNRVETPKPWPKTTLPALQPKLLRSPTR